MKKYILKSQSFTALIESYQNWLSVLGYAESTVYNLPHHLKEFFHYAETKGHQNLEHITTAFISEYYTHLSNRTNERRGGSLSPAFLNKHQQALKLFLKYLKEHNANVNFGVHLKGEKVPQLQHKEILSLDEIKQLFDACAVSHMNQYIRIRDKAILVLLYSCGLRRNEAEHVNCDDILFEQKRIFVRQGKNYKQRYVPINSYNLEILETYMYEARLYFLKQYQTDAFLVSMKGSRLNDMSIAVRLKAIIEASESETIQNKNITLHSLRHSIATHLMHNGVPIKSIATFLGHTSLESTQIYTHLIKQKAEQNYDLS